MRIRGTVTVKILRSSWPIAATIWSLLAVACCSGQEPSNVARGILSQTSAIDLAKTRERLLALGDSAVEPILDTIAIEEQATPLRLAFLIGVLSSLNSPRSQHALGRLLADQRPIVRGYSTSALGRNRVPCAVPRLVALLDDGARYGSEVTTDPHHEMPLAVGRAALEALESITGQHLGPSEHAQKVPLFQKWWANEKRGFNCRNWN